MREDRSGKHEIFNILVIIFLFLASLNFVTRYYYWMYIAFLLFVVTPERKVRINASMIILLLLGVFTLCFDSESRSMFTNILKPFVYAIAYVIGLGMTSKKKQLGQKESSLQMLILLATAGLFLHYVLNAIKNIGSLERNTIDIWTNSAMSATAQSGLACLCVGVVTAFLFSNSSFKIKVVCTLFMAFIIIYNMVLAGRTLLFMLVLMIVLAFLFKSIYYKKGFLGGIFLFAIFILVFIAVYNNDIFSIKTAFENTNFYARFFGRTSETLITDARLGYKLAYIKKMKYYPFGGYNIRREVRVYAHDLYLDSYDQTGVLGFLAIVFYMISSLSRMIMCLRSKEHTPFAIKQLVFCVYLTMNIQFLIEPIIQGMPWLFIVYCLIDGALTNYLASHKEGEITLAQ